MNQELFVNRVIMAPMAGINVPSFCELLIDCGCDFIYSGLLSSHALVRRDWDTAAIIDSFPGGIDFVAQIFGSDPAVMAASARRLADSGRVLGIDINMGCPVKKVNRTMSGAALMRDIPLAARVVRAVADAVQLPVSVKLRAGWSEAEINALDLARACVDSGAAAVALHPRTRVQGFSGRSDWSLIARLKESLPVPVIGSGDIFSPEDAARMIRETGCDSVMIGRGALGDPALPGRVKAFLRDGERIPAPDGAERVRNAIRQYRLHLQFEGPKRGMYEMRKFVGWYLRGLPDSAALRSTVNRMEDPEAVLEMLGKYETRLREQRFVPSPTAPEVEEECA